MKKRCGPKMDEHGLTGSSGLFAGGHIAAPYGSTTGHVFVAVDRDGMPSWRRCTPKQAKRWKKTPIGCGVRGCKFPAVKLDHYWPWCGDEFNRCAKHANKARRRPPSP